MLLPSVMIVEDDPTIREIYLLKFELEGYRVCAAENGQVALDMLETFRPDIILLDMMMPVMNGVEFMRRLRAGDSSAEVIVFSNISAADQVQAAMGMGATEYWIKSDYTPDRVLEDIMRRWGRRSGG